MADIEITDLLTKMYHAGASDLYLAPGIPPRMNVDGTLNDVQTETLSPEDVVRLSSPSRGGRLSSSKLGMLILICRMTEASVPR